MIAYTTLFSIAKTYSLCYKSILKVFSQVFFKSLIKFIEKIIKIYETKLVSLDIHKLYFHIVHFMSQIFKFFL